MEMILGAGIAFLGVVLGAAMVSASKKREND